MMKWYYYLALAGLGYTVFRFRKGIISGGTTTGSGVDDSARTPGYSDPRTMATTSPQVVAVIREAEANWPGGAGNWTKIVPADQTLYPGFWTNEHGGYYNPTTGESYSPGTSPVVLPPSAYESGAMVPPTYDLGVEYTGTGNASAAETTAGGFDVVY
jgi:hypothetical protein